LQRLAHSVSRAVQSGRGRLMRRQALTVQYAPVVRGRVRAELRGSLGVKGRNVVVVARGTVAFTSQRQVRLRLRKTPAARRLVLRARYLWLHATFSAGGRDDPVGYGRRLSLPR